MNKPTTLGLLNLTAAIAISLGILIWGVRAEDDLVGQTGFVLLLLSIAVGFGYLAKGFSASSIVFGMFWTLLLCIVIAAFLPAS